MAHADARVGALSIRGTAGTIVPVELTWPAGTTLGTVVVSVGDDDYPAVVAGNVANVELPVPDANAPLAVTVDGDLRMTGEFTVSTRGTDSPDTAVTVETETVQVAVDIVGRTGPQGPQGPQGETGPQGPQGDPGVVGISRTDYEDPGFSPVPGVLYVITGP